ncbi:DUF262 domain-containing protein [Methylobacterium sp. E-046]|uniref:DUF262 domain-containing protein n=1 Tax=Methylobacterium sp. E-046 TaxID=2836576 RepID=UPI001FBBE757|nr:DUF262 domain-containing protein [Methylobacterium sp. E-046]MCJ2097491.1 DUF262 domain-containing HNH endonuclease family protein [Methylobacterium sp. E-046]
MKPDKLSIHDLFQKERRYVVPLYQRAYVWNEDDQWQPLWDDIERQAEGCLLSAAGIPRRSHFLGAVVLNVQKIVGSAVARSEVIDGQQRLTTLQLFIAALRDFAIKADSIHANKLKRLTINEDEKPGAESSFKVWPTNADRALFRSIMLAGGPEQLLAQNELTAKDELPRLIGAYCYFYRQIALFVSPADDTAPDPDNQIFGLIQALRVGLQMVVIELEDNDDPQIIFETLNARGQPLLPSDLIRNTVFHQASIDPAHIANETYADGLYDRFWHQFDNDRIPTPIKGEDRYWHILERQGRLTRPRIDLFIFHFLVMQTGRELMIGHIFQEFRDWRDNEDEPLEDFLSELKRYSSIFRNLISPSGQDRASVFARRLRTLDSSTAYPLLLYILGLPTAKLSQNDKTQILTDLESWLIRRLVCQLSNKNYNKFFVSLLARMKAVETKAVETGTAVSPEITAAVRDELTRSNDETNRWPNNDEFERGWMHKAAYVKSRPDRAVMLLAAVDTAMKTSKNEFSSTPVNLTVEHLLPQQGSVADYPYPSEPVTPDGLTPEIRRARIIHTIGNLTLLTQSLNSSVSNGPFSQKRPEIALHSELRLNARFQDETLTNWLENDIAVRGRDLFVYAKSIWPVP